MLLINIHELEVVFRNAVILGRLEDEIQDIGGILSLEGQHVLILRRTQHLSKGREINTESDVSVAAIGGETLVLEHHGHQGDMAVIHGLEGDAAVIAVEIAILDEILDRIDNLGEKTLGRPPAANLQEPSIYLLQDARLLESCLQHCYICERWVAMVGLSRRPPLG